MTSAMIHRRRDDLGSPLSIAPAIAATRKEETQVARGTDNQSLPLI